MVSDWERPAIHRRTKIEDTYRLNAPFQVVLQIGNDHAGIVRGETRSRGDRIVEVYETLGQGISSFITAHEYVLVMPADEGGASPPLLNNVWDCAQEDQPNSLRQVRVSCSRCGKSSHGQQFDPRFRRRIEPWLGCVRRMRGNGVEDVVDECWVL